MTDLHQSRFYDLLPPNLRNAHTAALSYAEDRQIRALLEYLPVIHLLSMVEDLSEALCDQLAANYNIREYSADMSLAIKRDMIRFSFQVSAKQGTRWAVNRLIQTVFGSGGAQEWFEYGGSPHYFKVSYTAQPDSGNLEPSFISALEEVKRKSAWLESITRKIEANLTTHTAHLAHTHTRRHHSHTPPATITATQSPRIGTTVHSYRKISSKGAYDNG